MSAYRWLLGFLGVALAAALAAWVIGADPGYVLIERGAWRIETSVVFAAALFVAGAVLVPLLWWMLRWPLVAWSRRRRRRAREKLAHGMLALAEGRPARAGNLLLAASRLPSLKQPALVAAVLAARQRGDDAALGELLGRLAATAGGDVAAVVLRAEAELAGGRAGVAIELLDALDQAQRLPPGGVRVLITALARRGRAREGLAMLARLKKTQVMSVSELERFEAAILADALTQATDAINLTSLWADLSRQQRRQPEVVLAFARRGAELGIGGEIHDEIESVLDKHHSAAAVDAWSRLPGVDPRTKLARAEAWLAKHPGSVALLLAIGRLYRDLGDSARAEAHFKRAVSSGGGASAWEELAQLHQAQGDWRAAVDAYSHALAARRGSAGLAATSPAADAAMLEGPVVAELRNEHGVPILPAPARTHDAA